MGRAKVRKLGPVRGEGSGCCDSPALGTDPDKDRSSVKFGRRKVVVASAGGREQDAPKDSERQTYAAKSKVVLTCRESMLECAL